MNRDLRLPSVAHRHFWYGEYADESSLSFLPDALPESHVFFDIGVHGTVLWLAKNEKLTIQTFELISLMVTVLTEMFELS